MSFEKASSLGKQRLIDIGPDQMWTEFLEQINDLMIEEKAARQVSDHVKLAEICTRVVSIWKYFLNQFHMFIASNLF
mgnify:FL=1